MGSQGKIRRGFPRTANFSSRLIVEVDHELPPAQQQAFEAMKPKPADLTLALLQVESKFGRNP